jgi:hypothetical protein
MRFASSFESPDVRSSECLPRQVMELDRFVSMPLAFVKPVSGNLFAPSPNSTLRSMLSRPPSAFSVPGQFLLELRYRIFFLEFVLHLK